MPNSPRRPAWPETCSVRVYQGRCMPGSNCLGSWGSYGLRLSELMKFGDSAGLVLGWCCAAGRGERRSCQIPAMGEDDVAVRCCRLSHALACSCLLCRARQRKKK